MTLAKTRTYKSSETFKTQKENREDKKFTFGESWRTPEDFLRNPIFSPCVCVANGLHLCKQIKGPASFGRFSGTWVEVEDFGTNFESILHSRMDS